MTWQVNSWIDALAAFLMDQGWSSFGLVDVGRSTDDQDVPPATIILTEVPGVQQANMGWGNDVSGGYCNVLVRGAPLDYQGPRDAVWTIMRQLHRLGGRQTHGYQFVMIGGDAAPTPTPLGRDLADRFRWTVDVPVWFLAPALAAEPTIIP